jgi:hypothetical protein
VFDKLVRIARRLFYRATTSRGSLDGAALASPTGAERLVRTYMDAVSNYVPLGYDGSITVLWPEREADLESAEEALAGWRRISPDADLETVPGDHVTAITVHAKVFAQRMAARLAPP